MASFCSSCGKPIGGPSGFCGNCGASAGQAPQALAPPAAVTRGSAVKWVLLGLGVLFVLGVVSAVGMYFTARRYVTVAESVTGVKAGDVVSSIREAAARSEKAPEGHRDGCLLLSKEEASAILEIPVERVDSKPNNQESGEHCDFFVKAESIEQNLANFKAAAEAAKGDPATGTKPNQLSPAAMDMLKTMNRGIADGAGNGEMPYLRITVERENGRVAFNAFQIADRLGSGDLIGGTPESLGVGDRAAMGIGDSRLCVLKGNFAVTLDLTQVTGARLKGVALAKIIVSRL